MTFPVKAAAARLLAEDPLFAFNSDDEKRAAALAVVVDLGGDPDNELFIQIVAEEAERMAAQAPEEATEAEPTPLASKGPGRPPKSPAHAYAGIPPVLQLFSDATGMSDMQIGNLIGVPRAALNLRRRGLAAEDLTREQAEIMRAEIMRRAELLETTLDKLG